MSDLSPTGAPFAISERASASAPLERGYRRLVRIYPRSFRRESTEEIVAVLLATARADQRRPSAMEAADLLRGAARMRLGLPGCPRTVLYAVRLMYLGVLAEITLLVTVLLSLGAVEASARAAALRALGPHPDPAAAQLALARVAGTVNVTLAADVAVTLAAIACWLFLAWASGKGFPQARAGAVISCALYGTTVILAFTRGDLTAAPVAVAASCAVLAIGVTANVLLVLKPSWPYFEQRDFEHRASAR